MKKLTEEFEVGYPPIPFALEPEWEEDSVGAGEERP
jgi:hypothetical protein